jgi:phosphoribosylformylglycinamidine cyclo-ligase
VIVGLASSGFHTNGYSLLRKLLFERMGLGIDDPFPDSDSTVADVLLRVHRSYLHALHPLLTSQLVNALAHITGGGLPGNLERVIPEGLQAVVRRDSWEVPPEFTTVMRHGRIDEQEMFRTFNMGVGMVLVVTDDNLEGTLKALDAADVPAWRMGNVQAGSERVRIV